MRILDIMLFYGLFIFNRFKNLCFWNGKPVKFPDFKDRILSHHYINHLLVQNNVTVRRHYMTYDQNALKDFVLEKKETLR